MSNFALTFAGFFLVASGCSLVNAPDELSAGNDGSGSTGAGDGDGDGDGDDLGGGPGTGGSGDGDGDGDGDIVEPPQAPTTGLIVLAGREVESGDQVLLTLQASNGDELDREMLPAAAVAYDEKPGRFVWFVFTSTKPENPSANTLAGLQLRRYDDVTNEWITLSKVSALPPPVLHGNQGAAAGPIPTALFKPVVLNNRLAYISQTIESGVPVLALTVLDTSDLENVIVQGTQALPSSEAVVGLVGRRGTELDEDAVGGSVSVMVGRDCDGLEQPTCNLFARPVTIGKNISELQADNFGSFQGEPAFASTPVLPDSVDRPFKTAIDSLGAYALAYDPTSGEPRWWQFDPADPASKDTPSSLGSSTSTSFSAFAVSECFAAGIAGDASAQELSGIHLANANVLNMIPTLGDKAADVLIEPFRTNAVVGRSPGADCSGTPCPVIRAYQIETIGDAGSQNIALAPRAIWNAPNDVDPLSVAVRLPQTPNCN